MLLTFVLNKILQKNINSNLVSVSGVEGTNVPDPKWNESKSRNDWLDQQTGDWDLNSNLPWDKEVEASPPSASLLLRTISTRARSKTKKINYKQNYKHVSLKLNLYSTIVRSFNFRKIYCLYTFLLFFQHSTLSYIMCKWLILTFFQNNFPTFLLNSFPTRFLPYDHPS